MKKKRIVIVGAGPAGLTAAAQCLEFGHAVHVLERDPEYVGGISRTVCRNGFRFDIGSHRFFTKNPDVNNWWRKRLGDDFLKLRRQSRIFYRGKFYDYPLKAIQALRNLGLRTSVCCILSYLRFRLFPIQPERSFEDWVTNRFGKRLFDTFFKSYTEKVWGMPCSEISPDWAAQRIKGLSLIGAIMAALGWQNRRFTTLTDRFEYPRLGTGMMWEKTRDDILAAGARIAMAHRVYRIEHSNRRVSAIIARDAEGRDRRFPGDEFIVSMPLRETIECFDPPLDDDVIQAAKLLRYRDFISVALVIDRDHLFTDNWIYIHDPSVKVARIQNFNNWSRDLIPRDGVTSLGLEYFCFEGDGLWERSDDELAALAKAEVQQLGFARESEVLEGYVIRTEKAYPVYDDKYSDAVAKIAKALRSFENIQPVGRNGMHRYNNQDHSMVTAMLAAENIKGPRNRDLWAVNADAIYHEENEEKRAAETQNRLVPRQFKDQGASLSKPQ